MPTYHRLKGACHNVAHHAVSGLCFVAPLVRRACRNAGLTQIAIDLRDAEPRPAVFAAMGAPRSAFLDLQATAWRIIAREGFVPAYIAILTCQYEVPDSFELEAFMRWRNKSYSAATDGYALNCRVSLTTVSGKEVTRFVDWRGTGVRRRKTRVGDYPLGG